ncbi:MAG: RNA methyltransferase [Chlorobium sp.]|jgi:23S rRNA (guanosine2251-2'-O)-methyltransferase|uniref:RNA methyltransferase n=1 Tax=Chlorobium sp. TaxID=1095 RepID=UPI001DD4589D|nr:RNA methyltransferase [Chlorobium sp.]MBN1279730.1 RNA methyltransferase [Chlorobiaceae bacterium]MCF8215975.1 RNA methyltransferase [Chlorobium sp.]MCF8270484.1 RNA methyltransferase [Chlorobium sp.]MCF8287250.1 RNA methyltransferase [Chlorobium sp.]MCF8290452.1 RNA methyltransferase [Chlorobium sp.]
MSFRKLEAPEMNRISPENLHDAPRHPICLMLHNIRSMWNVGSMFRTADAAGIEKMFITGYTATPPRKEIDKTALGAQDCVRWEYRSDPLEAIALMKASGFRICGLEITENSRPYTVMRKNDFPVCLLVGNEVQGIEDEVLMHCDEVLEIPQYGTKHSLNVAVAAGIALFELVRVVRSGM